MPQQTSLKGPVLVLIGALCFSTSGSSQAIAPEGASPLTIGALRMLIGGLALLIWCAARGLLPKPGYWPLKNMLIVVLGIAGGQVCFFKGILFTGVAVGTVVSLGFTPIAAALLAWLLFREKPARAWYPATFAAISGLILLNWGGGDNLRFIYLLLPLGSGLSYAFYLVFSKPLVQNHPPETIMMLLCLLSGLCLSPALFVYPITWVLTPKGLLVALNLGLVTAAMAFSLTLAGLRTTPTPIAATIGLAEPLGAALLGILYLHEPVGVLSAFGLLCIFSSVLLLIVLSAGRR